MLTRADLKPEQRRASDWIVSHSEGGCALWLDMGLGKTGSTIDGLRRLYDDSRAHRTLIVAPKRVAHWVWPKELGLWTQAVGLPYRVLDAHKTGVRAKMAAAFGSDSSPIHIVSQDNVAALVKLMKGRRDCPYDTVVIDEASSMKNHSSARFKAIRRMRPALRRVIELAGTPAPNGYADLWSQVFLIDGGARLGKTVTAFRERWFYPISLGPGRGFRWEIKDGSAEEIKALVQDLCLVVPPPPRLEPRENPIPVYMPDSLRSRYATLEREFMVALEDEVVTAASAAALSSKLRQFCNGALYLDDASWRAVHSEKLDALESVINEAGGPVLCAYQFRSDVDRIKSRFKTARMVDEPGVLDDWNRGEVPILLAHPQAAGHGLNLQYGGHTLCWFSLPWSLEHHQQMGARLARPGQNHPVVNHTIAVADTIDARMAEALAVKDITQAGLLAHVRRMRESEMV